MATAAITPREEVIREKQAIHRRKTIIKAILTLVTALILFVFIFPIYFWFSVSVKPFQYIFTLPPQLTFEHPTGSWYSVVLGGRRYSDVIREIASGPSGTGGAGTSGYYVVPFLRDSMIIGLSSTAIVVIVAS